MVRSADERDRRMTVLSGLVHLQERSDARRVYERKLAEIDDDARSPLGALDRFLQSRGGGHVEFPRERDHGHLVDASSRGLENSIPPTHDVTSVLAATAR